MRHTVVLVAILSSLLVAFPARGGESAKAAKAALIEEYIKVTEAERNLEESLRLAFDASDDQLRTSLGITEGDLAEMDAETKLEYEKSLSQQKELMRKILDRLIVRLDLKTFTREVNGPVLDRYFSADDLRAMIAFYKTPVGQKSIENEAKITIEKQTAMYKQLTPLMAEIVAEVQKEEEAEDLRRNPWKRALSDMRSIATAVEAYAVDEDEYPQAVSIEGLASVISPTYIRTVPSKDPWGGEYLYVVSADGLHYRLVSGGADTQIDGGSRVISTLGEGSERIENRSLDDDIIYQDAMFVTLPPGAKLDEY